MPDPLWYKDAIIYQTHVRCFADSNDDGIGDFNGLISKLDYIRDLGVTAIWLLPFYPSPLRDDGYDIADYTDVHPDYGTLRDFKRFVREAHRRELKVITELVINHTSDQHPWFQAARRAPAGSAKRDFYVWSDTDQKYAETRIIFTDTESSNWAWDATAQAYYWHRFFAHQPDLNHNNPKVVQAVIRLMHFWFALGVDGLRLDAIPYLCVREGTNNENLPETHQVIKQLRAAMDARFSDRLLLAEANQWPEDAREYFGDGDECNMAFHFPLMPRLYMAVAQEDRYPITEIMRQTPEIPENCQWAIFLRNHDELTLEMVTDGERDYMYRVYAAEPRMRCNVGIRRRLAPLMDNDKAKIRLLNSLLLSMPGTPILYYGDEIGMGDNIYLGDRNGVRTPMQWSIDRNGGFSKADPGRLYLPPIMDPLYGYQAVNVEAQQRSPTSLLNWMRQLIAVRQAQRAFSRGELRFIFPGNRKILAYIREVEGEDEDPILCVANLSRHAQPVELDLSEFRGRVPVELLGRNPFPPVGSLPYLLTLPGHGFYWFRLTDEADAPRWHVEQEPPQPAMPFLVLKGAGLSGLLGAKQRRELERDVLPAYLAQKRWYTAKGARIERVTLHDLGTCGEQDQWLLTIVEVQLDDRPAQHYFLPLAVAWDNGDEDALSLLGGLVLCGVRRANRTGLLFDALHDELFVRALSQKVGADGEGAAGRLGATRLRELPEPAEEGEERLVRWLEGATNTSCVVDERMLLKVYRRLQPGSHPEVAMGSFLSGQPFVADTYGALTLKVDDEAEPWALGLLQQFVVCRDDAWHYVLDQLSRFLDAIVTAPPQDRRTMEDLEGFFTLLGELHLLGERTAQMHRALAQPSDDPSFAPELLTDGDLRAWREKVSGDLEATAALVEAQRSQWEGSAAALGARLLEERPALRELLAQLQLSSAGLLKTRHHGDFHLGQMLVHEHDFIFIDFEGEPAVPLAARSDKHSPLRDLAGLVRSIDYAARSALRDFEQNRGEPDDEVLAWMRRWQSLVLDALRAGYFATLQSDATPAAQNALLELFVLEKALYEVRYEIDHRPDWVGVPLAGLLETFIDGPRAARARAQEERDG